MNVNNEELLVRGIVHPLFCSDSKNRLKSQAFLPPPNRNDVSLLRHAYTNDDFCKKQTKSISIAMNQSYFGVATFIHKHIDLINSTFDAEFKVFINATPLDTNNNYRKDFPVFISDKGLPMHSDLVYNTPVVRGEPNTLHRAFADKLCKVAYLLKDQHPSSDKWENEKICWKEIN